MYFKKKSIQELQSKVKLNLKQLYEYTLYMYIQIRFAERKQEVLHFFFNTNDKDLCSNIFHYYLLYLSHLLKR
jgi:hypothetical protein